MFNPKIVCTYLYSITKYGYPPDAKKTIQFINEMKSLGFKSIELEGIRDEHLSTVYDMKEEIAGHLKENDINLAMFCAVLPGCSSLDEKERNKSYELFEKGCEIAVNLGSKAILDNGPLPPYVFPDDIPVVRHYEDDSISSAYFPHDLQWERFWDIIVNSYQTLCEIAAHYNLTYNIHPALGLLASTTDSFLYLFDKVKKDNLRFNLDTANQFVMKDNIALSLIRLKDHVNYIHISDNNGTKVEHLDIGKGKINWNVFFETLDRINFNGHIGIDVGGAESAIDDMDKAYLGAAKILENKWLA
ncbi:MAG: sugar phosphate isomerase/epimerase family protein [Ignavibacteria bacterium]|jgi:sugar phosphate isomerase/epimerase